MSNGLFSGPLEFFKFKLINEIHALLIPLDLPSFLSWNIILSDSIRCKFIISCLQEVYTLMRQKEKYNMVCIITKINWEDCDTQDSQREKTNKLSQSIQEARDLSRVLMDGKASSRTAIANLFFHRLLKIWWNEEKSKKVFESHGRTSLELKAKVLYCGHNIRGTWTNHFSKCILTILSIKCYWRRYDWIIIQVSTCFKIIWSNSSPWIVQYFGSSKEITYFLIERQK